MTKNGIDPQLKKLLESLQETPERGLQASHASRENYIAQVRSLKPRALPQEQNGKKSPSTGRRSWISRFAAITAVLIILFSTLGGTVYAAQASGPDDLLYGVKTLTEELQAILETDPQEKLDLYVYFASRRLQEIQGQIEAGEEVSEKVLFMLEKPTERMLEQAAKLEGKGLNRALIQIERNLERQTRMMAELGKEHPQGGPPDLIKAQEKNQERLELVEDGKNEPQGFKDKVKEQKENSDNPGQSKKENNGNSNKPDTPPGQEKKNNNGNGNGNK